ncbi:LamG-like jellyroll fold domain-containing protein [Yeosuana marina]|uniref:LamG-like jellyroll fold domain-containing protein n=1 Tax=Yeosuana marina TaxID=1565536 RepID=UPI0030C8CA9F
MNKAVESFRLIAIAICMCSYFFVFPQGIDTTPKIDFDGIDDYIDLGNVHNLTNSFSLEAWVLQEATVTNGTIISKGDSNAKSKHGYQLSLINNYPNITWYNATGNEILNTISPYSILNNKWYHIAATFDGETVKLFVDGLQVSETLISTGPWQDEEPFIIGAVYNSNSSNFPTNYFNGFIDEVRVWNIALTERQIHEMMNQEIEQNDIFVKGKVVPLNISDKLLWSNLEGYYPMTDNLANDASGNNRNGIAKNMNSIQLQSAPLPYKSIDINSATALDWDTTSTWLHGNDLNLPNTIGVDGSTRIDWNIVETRDPIFVSRNLKLLGLKNSADELSITASHSLDISNYLKLDGMIDLDGESQLIQGTDSYLDPRSTGTLERDQQGTKDLYTYNYWSSPVGISNTTTNNNSYKLPDILKDGSIPSSPLSIHFLTSGYNGDPGDPGVTPISIADYWVWKYASQTNNSNPCWQHVRSTGTLKAGEGYTMKGVAATGTDKTQEQNYVFKGKPNNGDITIALPANKDYLLGNPYPSALDADEFIRDNTSIANGGRASSNIINGTLYFWEDFTSQTHALAEYHGGFAMYSLMGGTKAIVNDARLNQTGLTGTKIPQRYVPVSQGFFVFADAGGNLRFKNSQRTFKTETLDPSIFIKTETTKENTSATTRSNNTNTDKRQKIKLLFDSPIGYHRQLLVGVDQQASNDFDFGYDAPLIEDNKEDMFWVINENNYIIQAINDFSNDQNLPLGFKIYQEGLTTIKIDELENIAANLDIFVHDKEQNTYHNLKESNFEVYLTTGNYLDRFEITFSNAKTSNTLESTKFETNRLNVYYSNASSSLIIQNSSLKDIESAQIFNMLGQSIYKFETIENKTYQAFKTKHLNAGTYIIKVQTAESLMSKKILIQ